MARKVQLELAKNSPFITHHSYTPEYLVVDHEFLQVQLVNAHMTI